MKLSKTEKMPEFAVPAASVEQVALLVEKGVHRLNQFRKETLAPLGLKAKHLEILFHLEQPGSLGWNELGRLVHVDRSTLEGLVGDLQRVGMVERPKGRSGKVGLTVEGKGILSLRVAPKGPLKILSVLAPEEQKTLIRLLRKLIISHFADQNKR